MCFLYSFPPDVDINVCSANYQTCSLNLLASFLLSVLHLNKFHVCFDKLAAVQKLPSRRSHRKRPFTRPQHRRFVGIDYYRKSSTQAMQAFHHGTAIQMQIFFFLINKCPGGYCKLLRAFTKEH